jgi:nucleotide-binding universal stress UspA family protein
MNHARIVRDLHALIGRRLRPGTSAASFSDCSTRRFWKSWRGAAGPGRASGAGWAGGQIMRRILVATDGSSGGDRALDFAAALARDTGGTLTVVNVSNELSREDVQALDQIESGLTDEMDNEVLDDAKKHVQAQGGPSVEAHVAYGQPVQAILDAAKAHSADLIVLGRRGRGQLAGLLLGSVSQKLAGLSPCPVVIVP